jgi:hypothetical protein
MNQPNRENVVVMRANTHPSVIPMPSRDRAQRASAAVVQMPSRFAPPAQRSPSVITMPVRAVQDESDATTKLEEPASASLTSALRLTLLALFAWLGWPRPTHGKDPGAASARPWKPARLTLISALHLPMSVLARHKVAAILNCPAAAPDLDPNSAANLRAA